MGFLGKLRQALPGARPPAPERLAVPRPVFVSDGVSDAFAVLTMMLESHAIELTSEELAPVLARSDDGGASALSIVETAAHFGLMLRGIQLDQRLYLIEEHPLPCIAHLAVEPGRLPRPFDVPGRFVLLTGFRRGAFSIIDPSNRVTAWWRYDDFARHATGVFLVRVTGSLPPAIARERR